MVTTRQCSQSSLLLMSDIFTQINFSKTLVSHRAARLVGPGSWWLVKRVMKEMSSTNFNISLPSPDIMQYREGASLPYQFSILSNVSNIGSCDVQITLTDFLVTVMLQISDVKVDLQPLWLVISHPDYYYY